MFEQKGVIVIEKENCPLSEDDLMIEVLDNGADDFSTEDEVYEIKTDPKNFSNLTEALSAKGITFLEAGIQMIPSNYITLDEASGEKMQRLIDNLEDLDDVLEVYHNWDE